jgi:DNA-binding transcriptional LysR family regulator
VGQGKKGLLRIGFHASMLFRGLPLLLEHLQRDEPQVDFELLEMASQDQAEAILAGRMDVGFAHTILAPEPLSAITVYSEPFVACLPAEHPAARHTHFSLELLRHADFILFSRMASPAYFDRIISLCVEAGFTPYVRHQVRQWLTVVSMVSHGMGVAIVPKCLSATGIQGCVFRPLPDASAASTIQCMWLASDASPLVSRLVGYAQRFMESPQALAMPGSER